MRIFKDNGHNESEEAIKEWFHGETAISFRSFFSPLVENYVGLLKVQTLTDVNHNIVNEFFKEGKLEKKGHVVHNWKMRWFVLTGMSLTYYETQEKAVAKVPLGLDILQGIQLLGLLSTNKHALTNLSETINETKVRKGCKRKYI